MLHPHTSREGASNDVKVLGTGNVAVKFNFLCSTYFWIPCTVQITKNVFLDFSSFTGVINARVKLRMNYSYYMRSKDT